MDNNKLPIQAGIIGYCLTFFLYKLLFNGGFLTETGLIIDGGGMMGWLLNFIVPALVAAGAYFGAKQIA